MPQLKYWDVASGQYISVSAGPPGASYVPVTNGVAPNANQPPITPPEGALWLDTSTTYPSAPTLPPPVTSGSTLQTYTDGNGELWVAKNGVYSGNWMRPRDVLYCRVYRNAALTLPTAQTVIPFDTIMSDNYGMWSSGNNACIIPVAGIYLVTVNGGFTSTATNQNYTIWINQSAGSSVGANHIVSSAASQVVNAPLTSITVNAVNDQVSALQSCSAALASLTNANNCFLYMAYLGSG